MRHVPKEEGGNGGYVTYAINDNFSTLDGRILSLESVPAVVVPSGRKNYIINGNFDIWQRATSQTSSGYGSADRWAMYSAGTTKTTSRQTFTAGQIEVPNNPKYFVRHANVSSAGAGNYAIMRQYVESVRSLSGGNATISFWAKADSPKNIALSLTQHFGTGGSPNVEFTLGKFALTTSWEKSYATVAIPSIAGKTIGTLGDCLQVDFWMDAGSNYNSATASLGQQSGTFDISQVQLEEGDNATEFERRTYADELQLCQRYCLAIADGGTRPLNGHCIDTATCYSAIAHTVSMRTTPVLVNITALNAIAYNDGWRTITGIATSGGGANATVLAVSNSAATFTTGRATTIIIYNNMVLDSEF